MARSTYLEQSLVNAQLTVAGSYDNATSGLTATDVKSAIDELAAAGGSTPTFNVNEETITANKTLVSSDDVFQNITSDTSSLSVTLPSSPSNGDRFVIKNDDASTETFDVIGGPTTSTLAPGEMYEAVYGTTKWMVI